MVSQLFTKRCQFPRKAFTELRKTVDVGEIFYSNEIIIRCNRPLYFDPHQKVNNSGQFLRSVFISIFFAPIDNFLTFFHDTFCNHWIPWRISTHRKYMKAWRKKRYCKCDNRIISYKYNVITNIHLNTCINSVYMNRNGENETSEFLPVNKYRKFLSLVFAIMPEIEFIIHFSPIS